MNRLRGERAQEYGARRLFAMQAREATSRHLSGPRVAVEVLVACPCRAYPVPHVHHEFEQHRALQIFEAQRAARLEAP